MKDYKQDIAQLSGSASDALAFKQLTETSGWKVFEGILRAGIGVRVKQLLDLQCKALDAHRIRGEVHLLEHLLDAPRVLERNRATWEARIQGLQKLQDALEYRGLDDHRPLPTAGNPDGRQEA